MPGSVTTSSLCSIGGAKLAARAQPCSLQLCRGAISGTTTADRCCCCCCLRPIYIGKLNQPGKRVAAGELFLVSLQTDAANNCCVVNLLSTVKHAVECGIVCIHSAAIPCALACSLVRSPYLLVMCYFKLVHAILCGILAIFIVCYF